eukprot:CAMPEP_0201889714 /NCGR_PEP_ID=MMETSP0902-20130614/30662_1 /ASSEMBLY_ACC=CAM_ASM_000551 /TAXON_ID=420261 /ORGANISM="Thalassiosira antarctica, Strain CCMP982" /LENGTH=40 /DNA_ID= /DNA_START= /DNA_END= /DNA_ORIENTATION=
MGNSADESSFFQLFNCSVSTMSSLSMANGFFDPDMIVAPE